MDCRSTNSPKASRERMHQSLPCEREGDRAAVEGLTGSTYSPKTGGYPTASCRAIDNRPYARSRKSLRIRRRFVIIALHSAGPMWATKGSACGASAPTHTNVLHSAGRLIAPMQRKRPHEKMVIYEKFPGCGCSRGILPFGRMRWGSGQSDAQHLFHFSPQDDGQT